MPSSCCRKFRLQAGTRTYRYARSPVPCPSRLLPAKQPSFCSCWQPAYASQRALSTFSPSPLHVIAVRLRVTSERTDPHSMFSRLNLPVGREPALAIAGLMIEIARVDKPQDLRTMFRDLNSWAGLPVPCAQRGNVAQPHPCGQRACRGACWSLVVRTCRQAAHVGNSGARRRVVPTRAVSSPCPARDLPCPCPCPCPCWPTNADQCLPMLILNLPAATSSEPIPDHAHPRTQLPRRLGPVRVGAFIRCFRAGRPALLAVGKCGDVQPGTHAPNSLSNC